MNKANIESPETNFNLGLELKNKKDYINSIKAFERVLEINSNVYQVFFNLGNIYTDLKDYDKAESNFKKAIDLEPNDHEIYTNLGNVLLQKKF